MTLNPHAQLRLRAAAEEASGRHGAHRALVEGFPSAKRQAWRLELAVHALLAWIAIARKAARARGDANVPLIYLLRSRHDLMVDGVRVFRNNAHVRTHADSTVDTDLTALAALLRVGSNGEPAVEPVHVAQFIATAATLWPEPPPAHHIPADEADAFLSAFRRRFVPHGAYLGYCLEELFLRRGYDHEGHGGVPIPDQDLFVTLLLIRHANWDELPYVEQMTAPGNGTHRKRIQNRYANRHRHTLRKVVETVDRLIDERRYPLPTLRHICIAAARLHFEVAVQHARASAWAKRLKALETEERGP